MLSVIIMFKATVVFVSCCCNTIPWQGHESSEEFLKCTREYMGILKADLHGTIFAYDCRMRFL